MRPIRVSRWLTRRRRCAQTGAPGLHRRFVLHPTCLSEANITLFVRLSAPVPCAAALLDMSSLGDHFLPVSDHFLGRWMSVGVQVFRGGVGWCWEVPSAAWGEARRPLGLVLSSASNPVCNAGQSGHRFGASEWGGWSGEVFWDVDGLQGHVKGA